MISRKFPIAFAFGACVVLSGCRPSTGPSLAALSPVTLAARSGDPWPQNAQRAPRLTTRVSSTENTALSGSDIPLVLSVTNHEYRAVTLYFASGCHLLHEVRDSSGVRVSPSWGCTDFPTSLTLGPGETQESAHTWRAARYDYHLGAYVPLPAGRYEVRAFLAGRDRYESQPFALWLTGE